MPAQVDQPQWLVRLGDGSLASLEQERWASPLPDEFRQALLEQLVVRHGAVDARGAGPSPDFYVRVGIDLRRFESIPGREARIEGTWALTPSRGPGATRCEWLISEAVGPGMAALATGHRRAVERLADQIAAALRQVARGRVADCPQAAG